MLSAVLTSFSTQKKEFKFLIFSRELQLLHHYVFNSQLEGLDSAIRRGEEKQVICVIWQTMYVEFQTSVGIP